MTTHCPACIAAQTNPLTGATSLTGLSLEGCRGCVVRYLAHQRQDFRDKFLETIVDLDKRAAFKRDVVAAFKRRQASLAEKARAA
jgi:hypothetical protein